MLVLIKSLKLLVLSHLTSITDPLLDPVCFALDTSGSYARVMLVDFILSFNIVLSKQLYSKLLRVSVERSICRGIIKFTTDRRYSSLCSWKSVSQNQLLGLHKVVCSDVGTLCIWRNVSVPSVTLIKSLEDTTIISLISHNDKLAFKNEVKPLVWKILQPETQNNKSSDWFL